MASVRELVPELVPWAEYLLRVASSQGWRVSVNSVFRSRARQTVLYQRYLQCRARGGRGTCLPAAVPGTSDHELGRAFDITVNGNMWGPEQRALGQLWQSWGGRWGGERDPVHFAA